MLTIIAKDLVEINGSGKGSSHPFLRPLLPAHEPVRLSRQVDGLRHAMARAHGGVHAPGKIVGVTCREMNAAHRGHRMLPEIVLTKTPFLLWPAPWKPSLSGIGRVEDDLHFPEAF